MAHNLPAIQQKAVTLRDYLHQPNIKQAIEDALPKWLSPERFLRVIFTATMKNPKIVECTPESILQTVMASAQLGLEPILGRAYFIPYNNSKLIDNKWQKVLECQFQPGYQGLIDLARRTNTIRDVYAMNVYENDEFDLTFGTDRKIHHRPWYLDKSNKSSGNIIGVYAVWEMKDGTKHPEFMTISHVYKRRDKSQAYKYAMDNPNNKNAQDCPWITWPEEMIIKTVIKHSSKFVPASIDFMQAVVLDDVVDSGQSQLGMFTDNPEYGGLLPESTVESIDVTKSAITTEPKISEPETNSQFKEMIKKETGKDFKYVQTKNGIAHDNLSAYLELVCKNQQGKIDPYELMENVSDEGIFPGFWNGFIAGNWKKHFVGILPENAKPKDESKKVEPKPETTEPSPTPETNTEKGNTNPFDQTDWSASGLKAKGTQGYWDQYKDRWESASIKSKEAFKSKWLRVFTKDNILTVPCPWVTGEQEPDTESGSESNTTPPEREPGDDSEFENNEQEVKIDYRTKLAIIQTENPELLIRACEAVGYGANLVIPNTEKYQKVLYEKYLELKK